MLPCRTSRSWVGFHISACHQGSTATRASKELGFVINSSLVVRLVPEPVRHEEDGQILQQLHLLLRIVPRHLHLVRLEIK